MAASSPPIPFETYLLKRIEEACVKEPRLDRDEYILNVASVMPAVAASACLLARQKGLVVNLIVDGVDLSFSEISPLSPEYQQLQKVCGLPYLRRSSSAFARNPKACHALLTGLMKSSDSEKDASGIQQWLRNTFLGWHCAHEDDEGLAHTVVALAPKSQTLTGQVIAKHIRTVGGCHLVANAAAAVEVLLEDMQRLRKEDAQLKKLQSDAAKARIDSGATVKTPLDHAYRLFLTIMFNNGRGTLVRGESPIVLVNPVVVHVHGTYLTSMATECAVRGYVEPAPSYLLVEQLVMQELMSQFKGTRGLYEARPDARLKGLTKAKPPPTALWHIINNPMSASPRNARDILTVPVDDAVGTESKLLDDYCKTRVKLAANTAAAFQAAAVIFVAQSDAGSKFRDREGRAAAQLALEAAVRAMLYGV